jgi:hypothetical protein
LSQWSIVRSVLRPDAPDIPAKKGTKGELLQYDEPDWLPLALVSGIDLLEDFMWMHEVRLSDDRRVHAYKHIDTRRYLFLDAEGNAYGYNEDDRYWPVPLAAALRGAVCPLWDGIVSAPGAPERARRAMDLVFSRKEGADTISRR